MSFNAATKRFSRLASIALAASILLAPVAAAKHASFDMPTCDRLIDGSGPDNKPAASDTTSDTTTNTVAPVATSAAPSDKPVETKKWHRFGKKNELQPLKLTDDKPVQVGQDGKVKLEVQQNVTNEQTAAAGSDPTDSKSIIDGDRKLADKLIKDGKKINVAPLALLESNDEAQQKLDMVSDAEKTELTDLWAATINRSPDIQFVINRLQPSSDPNHATTTAIRMLSGALFSAVQAVPMMMGPGANSMLMYGGVGSGASMLQNLLAGQDAKNAKKQQISQEQATILYKIVRDTADKLVLEFRKYKKYRGDYDRAANDLEDIKTMVATSRNGQDAAKQIEMEYTIRKAQRDLDDISEEARLHRQALADLAGGDAIAKLDGEIDNENAMLKNLTGGQALSPQPLEASPEKMVKAAPQQKDSGVFTVPQLAGKSQKITN